MAAGIPARLTPALGRRFGLTVGLAFLVLAAISRWRGHDTAPWVMGAAGGILTLAGLLVPARLGPVYRAWMGLALLLSKVTTPIFMGLIYFAVLTPTGAVMRLFGKNPLRSRGHDGTFWVSREPPAGSTDTMSRQF